MRIVSLFPAATEMLCQLGLSGQIVGVTHECDWPESVRQLPQLTRSFVAAGESSHEIDRLVRERVSASQGLYSLNRQLLVSLQPELIVTQSLCGVCAVSESEVCEAIADLPTRPDLLTLSPTCFDDLFNGLRQIGVAADCQAQAEREIKALQSRVLNVVRRNARLAESNQARVVVLEWIDPPFSSGHWTPELVQLAGGHEMIGAAGERSRSIAWNEVVAAAPEVMVIACCGYDVARTMADLPILRGYAGWQSLPCVQAGRVHIVDGSAYFNRPGPRLIDALELLAHFLHPNLHPLPANTTDGCQRRVTCV